MFRVFAVNEVHQSWLLSLAMLSIRSVFYFSEDVLRRKLLLQAEFAFQGFYEKRSC